MKGLTRMSLLAAAAALGFGTPSSAQDGAPRPDARQWEATMKEAGVRATFVHLAANSAAILYEPLKPGPKTSIALLATHGGDYLTFSGCTELSRRGYRVLCTAPQSGNLDRTLIETAFGVDYLRSVPGVKKVVLVGHSGGATIVGAYQAIAENGVQWCQDPKKLWRCPDSLAQLKPADGVIFPDANYGNALVMLFSVDPSVLDEESGVDTDPALDMYNPANGFKPGGTTYSAAFTGKFFAAEAARYNRLVRLALARNEAIKAGKGTFKDDEPILAPGASGQGPNNKLYTQDTRFFSRSKKPWPILRADGSAKVEIMRTVRKPPNVRLGPDNLAAAGFRSTVHSFLAGQAIRVGDDFGYDEDSITGVDWTSSYATPIGDVEAIAAPTLAMGMTGGWEALAAEMIYEHSKSSDKTTAFVEGASHPLTTCKECERTPGEFGDTIKTIYDYMDKWLSAGRFGTIRK